MTPPGGIPPGAKWLSAAGLGDAGKMLPLCSMGPSWIFELHPVCAVFLWSRVFPEQFSVWSCIIIVLIAFIGICSSSMLLIALFTHISLADRHVLQINSNFH